MYTREEASLIRQKFWKTFGQYMSYVPAADGRERINWINYKTGFKYVHIKVNTDKKKATIALVFNHPDECVQELMIDHLLTLKGMLPVEIVQDWTWEKLVPNEYYRMESKISLTIDQVNVFNEQSWPEIIRFFKQNFILLDRIWSEVQFAFEEYKFV